MLGEINSPILIFAACCLPFPLRLNKSLTDKKEIIEFAEKRLPNENPMHQAG